MVGLNNRLKHLRLERQMTQMQVSDWIGVSKAMVSAYGTATRLPSYDVLIKLSSLFGVSTDYLLGIDDKCTLEVTGLSESEVALISNMIDALRGKKL